jgi:hypothetical protein
MFAALADARRALEVVARDFDPSSLTPTESVRLLEEIGVIQRIVAGVVGNVTRRP